MKSCTTDLFGVYDSLLVSKSKPESELQEVYNKLKALNKAMENAEKYYE